MAFRNGVLQLLASNFPAFNDGRVVSQFVPEDLGLESGDCIKWECGQHGGYAEVTSVGEKVGNTFWCDLIKNSSN